MAFNEFNFTLEGKIENRIFKAECNGVIDSYEAFKEFKTIFFKIANSSPINHIKHKSFDRLDIKFIDSYPLDVNVIGFLLKLLERDGINITLISNDNRILGHMMRLYLDDKLNVKIFV